MIRRLGSLTLMFVIAAAPLAVPPAIADNVLVVTPSGEKVFQKRPAKSGQQAQSTDKKPNIQLQLLDQLEQLQQEVQQLRGQVEEQAHQLQRMQRSQRDRYLDLDRRLSELSSQSSQTASLGPATASPGQTAVPVKLDSKGMDDKKLYNTAQDFVQSQKFSQAIAAFNQLLEQYPDSRYIANAHYWLGEVYLAMPQPNVNEAKAHFQTVLDDHAGHPKVPASLYKLGKISDLSGDKQQAIKYLKKVVEQYPSSSSAGLARQYIQNLMAVN